MTALTVEVTEVHAAGNGYPWPTVIGTVLHGPDAGDVVRLAAEPYAAEAIAADLSELGAMPPVVVVEPWQVVALVIAAEDVARAKAAGRAAAYPHAAAAYRDGAA